MNILRWVGRFKYLSALDRKKFFSLRRLYRKADRDIKKFQQNTGLGCVSGCGRCCENPYIQSTVAELLPLALELWQRGEGESWLAKTERAGFKGRCVFYKPDPLVEGKGRCAVYLWRPLLCRLFGFSAVEGKQGAPSLVTCATIKQGQIRQYLQAEKDIKEGLTVPKMSDYARQVIHIDPDLGREFLPINLAVKTALQKVGLLMRYRA